MKKIICVLAVFFTLNSFACTTFLQGSASRLMMGKSYDWNHGNGLILINKRKVEKRALIFTEEPMAQWTSKYGSITFNQYGKEFPNGGLNEKGLSVEIMWLDSSIYPEPDGKPAINELQWIQYQLDNFSSVNEVLANSEKIHVSNVYARVHYLICDIYQECATVEYVNGKLAVHSGSTLPLKLLTNNTYEDSIRSVSQYQGFGGSLAIPQTASSLHRFARAADLLVRNVGNSQVSFAFQVLKSVEQPNYTKWNIVYDLTHSEINFKTANNTNIRSLSAQGIDYSCRNPSMMYVMENQDSGGINAKFIPYDRKVNLKEILESMSDIEAGQMYANAMTQLADSFSCVE